MQVLGVDCKLLYHYANTPLRAVRKKFVDIYPDEFAKTDFARCAWTSQTTVISWASINDVSQHLGFDVDHRRWRLINFALLQKLKIIMYFIFDQGQSRHQEHFS